MTCRLQLDVFAIDSVLSFIFSLLSFVKETTWACEIAVLSVCVPS